MNKLPILVMLAVTAWLVQRRFRMSRTGSPATGRGPDGEDCRFEECGPDGVPLSLYAG